MPRKQLLCAAIAIALPFVSSSACAQIQECARILQGGLRDTYQLTSSSSFDQIVSTLLEMSDEQLASASRSKNFGASIPVPIGERFLTLGLSGGSGRERLNTIRSTFRQRGLSAVSRDDYVWLTQQVVNPAIPAAWIRCIELTVERRPQGVQVQLDNDPTGRFGLILKWTQSSGAEQAPRIRRITLQGLRRAGESSVVDGATLPNLAERLLSLERVDTSAASITITFHSGHNDLFIRLPGLNTSRARLGGSWVLSGMPLVMRLEACTSCTPPAIGLTRFIGPFEPTRQILPGTALVHDVRLTLWEGGGSLQMAGFDLRPGTTGGPGPAAPGTTTWSGPFGYPTAPELRQQGIWFDYQVVGSTLRITRADLGPGITLPTDASSSEPLELKFTLLAPDVLMFQTEHFPLFFVRPDRMPQMTP